MCRHVNPCVLASTVACEVVCMEHVTLESRAVLWTSISPAGAPRRTQVCQFPHTAQRCRDSFDPLGF